MLVARYGLVTERLLRPWAVLAFLLNVALFALVGLALPTAGVLALAAAVGGGYLLMLATRAITVWLLTIGARLPWRWRQLTWWGGLRGALSIALALLVADTKVSTVAYGMVVLSLLLQGGLLRSFANRSHRIPKRCGGQKITATIQASAADNRVPGARSTTVRPDHRVDAGRPGYQAPLGHPSSAAQLQALPGSCPSRSRRPSRPV